jgi:Tol biopolymer transport system component
MVRADTQQYLNPRLSPDGRRIAMAIVDLNGKSDVWIHTLNGTSTRFTTDGLSDLASWSPDGRRLAWWARLEGVRLGNYWAPSDGSGAPQLAFSRGAGLVWSASGKGGFTITTSPTTGGDVSRVTFDRTLATVTPFLNTPATELTAALSRDGAWLAFVSNQSGRAEVYVTSTSDSSNPRQVSTHGGDEPVWSANSRELFYRDGRKLVAAQVETRAGFVIVRRDTLFADIFQVGNNRAAYDVMPDSRSFIMVRPIGAGAPPMIVFNWFAELKERMAQGGKT